MNNKLYLNNLQEGQRGRITDVPLSDRLYRRFLDLGIAAGTEVKCIRRKKGTAAYLVRQTVFAMRDADTSGIEISLTGND